MAIRTSAPTISDIWKGEIRLAAVNALPNCHLRLRYRDGVEYSLDLSDFVGSGNLANDLLDETLFSQVVLGEGGDYIEWPNGIDIGSDTLRWDAELQLRGLTRADVSEH